MYYIRFDGTGVCVESCPTETDWDYLWGCTDEDSAFTVDEGYDCASNEATCLTKAGLTSTGEAEGEIFAGDGDGTCMFQVKSIECEFCQHTCSWMNVPPAEVKRVSGDY